jgi:hypothetical protein
MFLLSANDLFRVFSDPPEIVAAARQPGERIVTTPKTVLKEANCLKRARPSAQLESMEVLPRNAWGSCQLPNCLCLVPAQALQIHKDGCDS